MNKSIIFCQAPTKIAATLACYEKEVALGNEVTIVVRNSESIYLFLIDLGLTARLLYFKHIAVNGSYLRNSRYVKQRVKDDIEQLKLHECDNVQIFFTDICDDFLMGVYLAALNKYPITKIQGMVDIKKNLDTSFKRKGLPLILRIKECLFTRIFKYQYLYTHIDHWTLTLNIKKYNYRILDFSNMDVTKKYLRSSSMPDCHKVILFTEPYRNKFQTEENYIELNKRIIIELHKKGYKVVAKGHPRIGILNEIKEMCDEELPGYIPAEFMDMECFDFAIGFVSTSICSATEQIPAYSILPMCTITDKVQADYWYDYLNRLSSNRVLFLKDFNQINL